MACRGSENYNGDNINNGGGDTNNRNANRTVRQADQNNGNLSRDTTTLDRSSSDALSLQLLLNQSLQGISARPGQYRPYFMSPHEDQEPTPRSHNSEHAISAANAELADIMLQALNLINNLHQRTQRPQHSTSQGVHDWNDDHLPPSSRGFPKQ